MGYKKILLLIFPITLICVAIYLAYKYSSCINWPVVTGITLIFTLIAIIGYTIETGRLRRATVRHTELSLRPFIIIFFSESDGRYRIRNIGKGHALNIKIDDIYIIDKEQVKIAYTFVGTSLMAPDAEADLVIRIQDELANDSQRAPLYPHSAVRSFDYTIRYTDINKKQYQTKGKIGQGGASVESTE